MKKPSQIIQTINIYVSEDQKLSPHNYLGKFLVWAEFDSTEKHFSTAKPSFYLVLIVAFDVRQFHNVKF
jgi:hypothetical protein